MRTTFLTLTALIAVTNAQITAAPSVSVPLVSGCPAIVSVTAICNTCVTLACIETAVVTAGCDGCPSTAMTVRTGYPCDQGCAGLGGCKTAYSIVTAQDPGECAAVSIGTETETAGSGGASGTSSSSSEVPTMGSIIPDESTTSTEVSGSATPTPGDESSGSVPTQTTPSETGSAGSTSSTEAPVVTNAAGRLRPWKLW